MFYTLDPVQNQSEVGKDGMEGSRENLKDIIDKARPRLVCFVGKPIYMDFFCSYKRINYGMQKKKIRFSQKTLTDAHNTCYVFVLPSQQEHINADSIRIET